ncbi:MAG: hypothetical protein VX710_06760 [Bacteroidota bacterium]|nr:hypothetical protein [Bacteroidota bacterium]
MTCYSLDFSFFEERVLPTLRLANIKNVNVLADGHYLEMAQEATTGKEFKHNKTYNFQPVYETGVFHPKIMLLTGVRHGLLIIGSGNITSSGLSTNDEIWGAFHLDNLGNENAPLFGAVWNYLQPYLDKSLGFVPQKIEWMRKQSPWLAELTITDDWINLESLNTKIKFIGNSLEISTYSQISQLVPSEELEEMTIISPYYDRSGKQLEQLIGHFEPKKIRCIVDLNSGSLPSELNESTAYRISFHSWSDCKDDYEDTFNRLHAKLVHWKFKKEEYILLGSANATIAAMGSGDSKAANGEAGIILRRSNLQQTWINELKVDIPEQTIDLSQTGNRGIGDGSVQRVNYKYRVLYSELRANEITIHLNKECSDTVEVSILNRSDLQVENTLKETDVDTLIVQVTDPEDVFKLSLSENGERISNYCIVHRLEALLRCNPDPNQEKLDAMLEEDFTDGEGITDLLQFVDYNWADDESSAIKKVVNHGSSVMRKAPTEENQKEYEVLQSEDFNKVSAESLLRQSGELSNSTVKIAEFLNLYSSGLFGKEDDFKESEEQKLFEDEEQQGEGDIAENKARKRTHGTKEKNAMVKYFKKLSEIYSNRLKGLLETQAITETSKAPITIRSLSSILIAMHLIQLKYGKKFTVLTRDLDEEGEATTKEESFINAGSSSDSVDTLKGFLLNVLGKFLLLSSAGNKHYEFEILNQKLLRSKSQLLVKTTCLILNSPWRESEEVDRDILILNCLYFLLAEQLLDHKTKEDFISKLDEYKNKAGYVIPEYVDQLADFKNDLLPSYIEWLEKFTDKDVGRKALIHPTSDLKYGNIMFNSKIGFNIVKKVMLDDIRFKLHLNRAGYPYVEGEFALKQVQLGVKSIKYK